MTLLYGPARELGCSGRRAAKCGGGDTSPAFRPVAERSTIGPFTRTPIPRWKPRSAAGSRRILAAIPGWSISKPSAARSSKPICAPSDQWPDLYGRGWVDALIHLYSRGEWIFADRDRRDGYSVVLFDRRDVRWRHPSPRQIEDIRSLPEVSSVQITFHEDRDPPLHAMPPGGFRLAIINCWNLEVGLAARNRLRMYFLRACVARSADEHRGSPILRARTIGRNLRRRTSSVIPAQSCRKMAG